MPNEMRAVRAHQRGGPERLVYETAPRPTAGPGEVLVAVRAAAITAGELDWDASWTDSFDGSGRPRTPVIPSHEVSGVVADLGDGVADFALGEEVYGLIPFVRDGAAAEYVSVPAPALAAKPKHVDHPAAAATPLAGLTGWQGLIGHAGLQPGQRVLIHGAAGGVGSFAVQIAVASGAHVVATATGAGRDFAAALGAETVVDYATERFEDVVRDVDVVFDTVGGETQLRSWATLRPGGVLVSIVAPPDSQEAEKRGARGVFFVVEPDRAGLDRLAELIDEGELEPKVDRVITLAETRAGYESLLGGGRRGKIVIEVDTR